MSSKSIHVMNWRNRVKLKLIEYKGSKCSICGYNKPIPSVYDFHHTDPVKKDFAISGKSFSYERLKKEVDKCILVCRNCHSEIHFQWTQEARLERLKIKKHRLQKIECKNCKKIFQPESKRRKYCSEFCAKFSRRKVNRPSKEILEKEIKEYSWVALGRKYKVTDNAVKKWARSYNLKI